MKHTPFFKFDAMQWLGGSIQFASLSEKGLFIDICAMYWDTWKPVQIDARFKVRYRYLEGTLSDLIGALSDLEIIVVSEAGITVPFLDEMIKARQEWLEKCSEAGKKGARRKGTSSNKKEERRKKKEESREENTPATPASMGCSKEPDEQFLALWRIYGLRGTRKKAWDQWKKLSEEDKGKVAEAIPDQLKETPDQQYRPYFERFIRDRVFDGVLERKAAGCLNIPQQTRVSTPTQILTSQPTFYTEPEQEGF